MANNVMSRPESDVESQATLVTTMSKVMPAVTPRHLKCAAVCMASVVAILYFAAKDADGIHIGHDEHLRIGSHRRLASNLIATDSVSSELPCLCIFDIDRTLTGAQGQTEKCPRNKEIVGVLDRAYGYGWLTLSALTTTGINNTFCNNCYIGVSSTGNAGGDHSAERAYLLDHVLVTDVQKKLNAEHPDAIKWSYWGDVNSPLALHVPNTQKQFSVEDIRKWYASKGIHISRDQVFFFGDRVENIPPFRDFGFNAREISCDSRDKHLYGGSGMVGFCGATPEEVIRKQGIYSCDGDRSGEGCHTAAKGEECYTNVEWVMNTGVKSHPHWYPGLTKSSNFEAVQLYLSDISSEHCPRPCVSNEPTDEPAPPPKWCTSSETGGSTTNPSGIDAPCLCVFDIDRTLTGAQGHTEKCPRNQEISGVRDHAYGYGWLTLSALSANGINNTFCNQCYIGVSSTGNAGGENSAERDYLLKHVLVTNKQEEFNSAHLGATQWSYWGDVNSPLALHVPNTQKQYSVEEIRQFYERHGVCIRKDQVYFFGDRVENIPPFEDLGFNAREISCDSRDEHLYGGSGMVGFCGATPEEVIRKQGIYSCDGNRSGEGCHSAMEGEECYTNVEWVMNKGVKWHPDWYPGLTKSSSFDEVQLYLSATPSEHCPKPCLSGNPTDEPAPPPPKWCASSESGDSVTNSSVNDAPCLCVFDIDRTLTGAQGQTKTCPRNQEISGVRDRAYGYGWLTLSALSANGINNTFCNQCYIGVSSTGNAGGENSAERDYLLNHVLVTDKQAQFNSAHPGAMQWSYWGDLSSPLVLHVPNTQKQYSVEDIRKFYERHGVCIRKDQVYFFGDRVENIPPFEDLGFNAREISCDSRDEHLYGGSGMVGFCGATPEEVIRKQGIYSCDGNRSGEGCHTAMEGEECYTNVEWVMNKGVKWHPHWYPGLTTSSSFDDVQLYLSATPGEHCPMPCLSENLMDEPAPPPKWCTSSESGDSATNPSGIDAPCLCVFDIDRTLTGAQGRTDKCPRNKEVDGVRDRAYGYGWLTLSALSVNGINNTFCNQCYIGVSSTGNAGGENSAERDYLLKHVLVTDKQEELNSAHLGATQWSYWGDVNSPLVLHVPNTQKQYSVEEIRQFYERHGLCIRKDQVYFFGDRVENIPPFEDLGFNAREISCDSRDKHLYGGSGMVGFCGATPEEVIRKQGIYSCDGNRSGEGCHSAMEGEECYTNVEWVMNKGVKWHPDWYPGLNKSSSFDDVQLYLSATPSEHCPKPCTLNVVEQLPALQRR